MVFKILKIAHSLLSNRNLKIPILFLEPPFIRQKFSVSKIDSSIEGFLRNQWLSGKLEQIKNLNMSDSAQVLN